MSKVFDEFIYACLFQSLVLYKKGEDDFESLCISVLPNDLTTKKGDVFEMYLSFMHVYLLMYAYLFV